MVVVLGWVLFRSGGVRYAIGYYVAMFRLRPAGFQPYELAYYLDGQLIFTLAVALVVGLGLPGRGVRYLEKRVPRLFARLAYARIPCLWLLLLSCMCMIVNGNYSPFIYFRF